MPERRRNDPIPASELTAYERWELPQLDQNGNEIEIVPVIEEDEIEVTPMTAEELENMRQEGWNSGFEEGQKEGFKQGHASGYESGHREGFSIGQVQGTEDGRKTGEARAHAQTMQSVEERILRLDMVMGELLEPIGRHLDGVETALINLVVALSRAVIHRELHMDSHQVQQLVREALAMLPDTAESLKITINPLDEKDVREVVEKQEVSARILVSDSVMPGGCTVETRHSLIDYTVEKRFQKAVQAMLERQALNPGHVEALGRDALMGELTDFHADVLGGSATPAAPDVPGIPDAEPGDMNDSSAHE